MEKIKFKKEREPDQYGSVVELRSMNMKSWYVLRLLTQSPIGGEAANP